MTKKNKWMGVKPKAPNWNSGLKGGKANKPKYGTRKKKR